MAGKNAFGYQVEHDDGSGTFTKVPNVRVVHFPNPELEDLETTAHGTADGVRTYTPGLINPGTVEVEFNFDSSMHLTLFDDFYARAVRQWRITDQDGATAEGEAYINALETTGPYDGISQGTMTLRFSGTVNYAGA